VVAVDAPITAENVPIAQLIQTVAEVAATVVEYVPARQLVQTDNPVTAAYFPATQLTHDAAVDAPTVAEAVPIAQLIQTVAEVAPMVVE
jgi:hypothetical protein